MGKQEREDNMSILTTQVSDSDFTHELVNENGIVIAQLSDAMFERLKDEGLPEKVLMRQKRSGHS